MTWLPSVARSCCLCAMPRPSSVCLCASSAVLSWLLWTPMATPTPTSKCQYSAWLKWKHMQKYPHLSGHALSLFVLFIVFPCCCCFSCHQNSSGAVSTVQEPFHTRGTVSAVPGWCELCGAIPWCSVCLNPAGKGPVPALTGLLVLQVPQAGQGQEV